MNSIWLIIFFFGIFLGTIAKLEPLASAETVSWDRSLLDRFLTLREDFCEGQDLCISVSVFQRIVWEIFMACSYLIRYRVYQMSCRHIADRNRWIVKILWEIWVICDLMKWMRSLIRMKLEDVFGVPRFLSCRNFEMTLLSLQRFRNAKFDSFLAREDLFAESVYFSKDTLSMYPKKHNRSDRILNKYNVRTIFKPPKTTNLKKS